ncbi:hypothetical protein GH146_02885 [archaeon]|nr:hypothetical protein [archaeon]
MDRIRITKGQFNKLIDVFVHPLFREHGAKAVLADGLLHAIVEGDATESVTKFLRYNTRHLVESSRRKRK